MIEGIFELKISLNRKYFQAQLEFKLHGAVFAVQGYLQFEYPLDHKNELLSLCIPYLDINGKPFHHLSK
jgi:hypothetical protein